MSGDDGVFNEDKGNLGINIQLVLERKKRRLYEHVRQARTALEGFEQAHGSKHFRSHHDQHKHKALKRDLEVLEEEFATLYLTLELYEASI